MIIRCPQCGREYRIEDSRIPAGGTVARCNGCGRRFKVDPPQPGEGFTCPKCGTRQPPGDECLRCGVIFGKLPSWQGPGESSPGLSSDSPEKTSSESSPSSPILVSFGERAQGHEAGGFMHDSRFSLGSAIRFGWDRTRENLGFFIGFLILGLILIALPGVLADVAEERAPAVTVILFRIVAVVLESTVTMGFIKVALMVHDGVKPEISNLLDCLPLFFRYFFASVLYGLIVVLGILLLVIPGVIWGIKYMFYGYFIVDEGRGPWDAIKASGAITRGAKLDLFLLWLVLAGINLLGLLALGVGLLVTIPLSLAASAYVFRNLQNRLEVSR